MRTISKPRVIDLAKPQQDDDRELMSLADLLRGAQMIWRRKWLILLGAVLGVGGGYAYFLRCTPVYQSQAQMLVVQQQSASGVDTQSMPDDDASVHVKIIKSPTFLEGVVNEYDLLSLPSFARRSNPTGVIVRSLSVSRDTDVRPGSGNAVLDFSYRGPNPDDCAAVLDAVINSYVAYLSKKSDEINTNSLSTLTSQINKLEKKIQQKQEQLNKFREEHGATAGTFRSRAEGAANRLAEIEAKSTQLRIDRALLEERLSTMADMKAKGADREEAIKLIPEPFLASLQPARHERAQRDSAEAQLQAKLYPLLLERQQLLDEWGPRHPKVLEIEEKIKFTRAFYAESIAQAQNEARMMAMKDSRNAVDPIDSYVRYLESKLADVTTQQQALDALADNDRLKAMGMAKYEEEESRLQAEVTRQQTVYDSLINASQQLSLTADVEGFATDVLAKPSRGSKVAPRRILILTVGLTLGLLGGLALAFLADNSDKSFRSPEEIRTRLQLPLLGHIPVIKDMPAKRNSQPGSRALIVRTYHEPQSAIAEAFRGVRAAVFASDRLNDCRVIQIASPNVGDGKSSLISNLAISIAQSGKSVLLIDADLRRPSVDAILGVKSEYGLSSLLAGEIECLDSIRPSGIARLDILPGGPVPESPADLITSPNLQHTIEFARERYDYVLIDTPALLTVTDGAAVAPYVDATILVIRIAKNGRTYAENALDILNSVQARVLGVVVNALQADNYHAVGRGYSYGKFAKRDQVYFTNQVRLRDRNLETTRSESVKAT